MQPAKSKAAFDVVCMGELVIDMVSAGMEAGRQLYSAEPGGAPGNVAVGLSRLGRRTAMVAQIGDDPFARSIAAFLADEGVDTAAVRLVPGAATDLAVVTHGPDGEREFHFYRASDNYGNVAFDDVARHRVQSAAILHVGSVAMISPLSGAAQAAAIGVARDAGVRISVDPNLRPALWRDPTEMRAASRRLIADAQFVKVGIDELIALTGQQEIADGVNALWHPELRTLAVTKGAAGAELFLRGDRLSHPGFAVNAIDTTGAGDAFHACFLAELLETGMVTDDRSRLERALARAVAAGALATTRRGGMTSLPTRPDLDAMV